MERARRVFALTAGLFLLAHCNKPPPPAPQDAGVAAPPPPVVPGPPPSLANFEGEVDLVAKSADANKPPVAVNMMVRNDRLRVDAPAGSDATKALGGGKAFLLVRVPDKKLDVVVESSKQAIELDLNNTEHLKSLAKSGPVSRPTKADPHPQPEPPPKIAKTGQKETIAGYPCEDWEITSGKDGRKKASLCVAEIAVSFFHFPSTGVPAEYSFALELIDGQHFPLRVVGYDDKTGAESGRVEVTKFERHPLEASLFEVPPGYKIVDAMQMIEALAGGRMPGMPPGMPSGLPGAPAHHKHH